MTGRGGWPMTVFLTPDLEAVLRRDLLPAGGLAHGHARVPPRHPEHVDTLWKTRREEVIKSWHQMAENIRQAA